MAKTIAIVPVRHFSQRVPGKNYRLLGQKPLYYYILDTLVHSNVDQVFIDTDSEIISQGINELFLNNNTNNKIIILRRPDDLCGVKISMNQIIISILERIKDQIDDHTIILQTHVTNPFVRTNTVNQALSDFNKYHPDTLLSVNAIQKRLWETNKQPLNHNPDILLQTQDLPVLYEENSCLYIFRAKTIDQYQNRIGPDRYFFEMNHLESWDIDTEEDFHLAQAISQKFSVDHDPILLSQIKPDLNYGLLNLLETELQSEIDDFLSICPNPKQTVLISAPYMMSEIFTFQQFYERLGLKVIVADVEERLSEQDLVKYHRQYDISVCGDDAFTRKIQNESGVKAICKWGTGIDSIDQEAAKDLGIPIYNTPDAFSIPVAQSILSAILSFARMTHTSTDLMKRSSTWTKLPGQTIEEFTVGIIGLGHVGRQTAQYLNSFGAKLHGYDILPNLPEIEGVIRTDDLETLLQESDYVCTCCTLTPSSYHIINRHSLKQMKKGSYLINMARGKLVEESALIDALQSKHLAGAALDVFEQEPLPAQSPLRYLDNVLISSHNANSSQKYWNKVHLNTIKNSLKAFMNLSS